MKYLKVTNIIPMVRNLGLFFIIILVVFFSMYAGQFPNGNRLYVPALSTNFYYEKSKNTVLGMAEKLGPQTLKLMLQTDLPVISIVDGKDGETKKGGFSLLKTCLNLLSGVKLDDPLTFLKTEIPMMAVTPVTADSLDETAVDEISEPSKAASDSPAQQPTVDNKIVSKAPLIALYNTHTSETFELTDGVAHLKGKAGGVSVVAKEIQKRIQEKYHIGVIYSPILHDLSFNKSYVESEKTVKKLLHDNTSLEMIFDIHRDGAMTREQSLTTVNGKKVAKILIVVGTNARADHPKWRENLEFSRKLAAKADAMYPGLCRGIAIKQGRYNQQYSPRATLVEIGSSTNTTDEAVESAKMFADIAVAVLNDIKAGK